jgi:hypothetical protein
LRLKLGHEGPSIASLSNPNNEDGTTAQIKSNILNKKQAPAKKVSRNKNDNFKNDNEKKVNWSFFIYL